MTERELTLFSAMSDIGDDLVLESGAFVPALGGAAVGVPRMTSMPWAARMLMASSTQ